MPDFRELPPKFKIYEALGGVADNRIEIFQKVLESDLFDSNSGDSKIIEARQYSSSRNNFIQLNTILLLSKSYLMIMLPGL